VCYLLKSEYDNKMNFVEQGVILKKNIWLWNHYATDMYKNNGGRHYWFAEELIKNGYDASIFCANSYHNRDEYIDTNSKKYIRKKLNGVPFIFVKTSTALGNGFDRVKNMFLFYRNLYYVSGQIEQIDGKPDIIIASSVHPLTMIAGIRIAKKMKIPCICEIRDLWPEAIFSFKMAKENSILGKILVAGEKWIYKNANALIFTKEGDTDYILEKKWDVNQGGKIDLRKTHYINNGVDIKSFENNIRVRVLEDEDLESGMFNVVYVGAIRPVNNVGNILDAAKLMKDIKDVQFLVYGDGNQKEELEYRLINENIKNVKFKGYINKQYIPYVLSKSSVNVLNYSQKQYNWARGNSSNKLFEYMASGKPIISTVKMGYSLIEKYNCGLELDKSSSQELADAIIKIKNMTSEEYLRFGNNARLGVRDFDFNVLTEKLIHVIESV